MPLNPRTAHIGGKGEKKEPQKTIPAEKKYAKKNDTRGSLDGVQTPLLCLSLSLSFSPPLSLIHSLSLSVSHSLCLTLHPSLSLGFSFSFSRSLSLSRSLSAIQR